MGAQVAISSLAMTVEVASLSAFKRPTKIA
jgi:hypothetical protein